jgi:PAS domain S-box-containing protein
LHTVHGKLAGVMLAGMLIARTCAFALNPALDVSQYAHTAWRIRDGFAKGSILSIAQTPDGYLWLGTAFGLYRFDGVRNVPWQPTGQHLPSSTITSLVAARDGTLWIGTWSGLVSWKNGKLTQYAQLAGLHIFALVEDHEGSIWAGTSGPSDGKLCEIRSGDVRCHAEMGGVGRGVFGLHKDGKGNLWVELETGVWRWRPGPAQFYTVPGLLNGRRGGMADGEDGALLIATTGGVMRLADGKAEAVYRFPTARRGFRRLEMLRDRAGGLWVCPAGRGIVHIHQGRTDVFSESDGLSGDDIYDLFEDREGNIWVATINGLDRFHELPVVTYSRKQGLSDIPWGGTLAARDGSVWFATLNGLNRLSHGQVTVYRQHRTTRGQEVVGSGLPDEGVGSLFEDSRGRIWVSTLSGIGYLENDRFVPAGAPGGSVGSLTEDTTGNLWIANRDLGLLRLSPHTELQQIPWATFGRKDPAVVLAPDPLHGGLWLGFSRGGIVWFSDGHVRSSYSATDGLGEGPINQLRFDSEGALWIASEGGLSRLKNGHIATLTSMSGLPCDAVQWTMEDDAQSVWLMMPCGLVRVARSELDTWASAPNKTRRTIHTTVFDNSDGLRSLAVVGDYAPRATKSADGKLWFIVPDGISVVDPRHLPFNKLLPPVHVEQVIADRKEYWENLSGDAPSNLRLPPLVRELEIDYTALSLVAPEKVLFRYKLEGWDQDWQDAGTRRQAFYGNLPPRNYTFRVKARNNSGLWNEADTSLDFSLAPVYYQTYRFRLSCFAALVALLWALHRWRIHQLRGQEKRLRDVVETIPAMTFTALSDGSTTFVNKRWTEYTGLSVEQSSGAGWQRAIHPEDLVRHSENWRICVATGQHFEDEARFFRAADQEYRWFLVRGVPLRNQRGDIVEWYGTLTDINDRKHAEDHLRDARLKLSRASKIATVAELSASIAHELNQPLTCVLANAQAAKRWLAAEPLNLVESKESIDRILRDVRAADETMQRIRALFRRESVDMRASSIAEILSEAIRLVKEDPSKHEVPIDRHFDEGLCRVFVDPIQIQEVFINLILNAVEAMEGSQLSPLIKIRTAITDQNEMLIQVIDNGPGVDDPEGIFDAFVTTKERGMGIGLAVSRSIVEAHSGRLWAENNKTGGATFNVALPLTHTSRTTLQTQVCA